MKLDLKSAFHQVPLCSELMHLTAFITQEGIYQFTRMRFGLASAASVFQQMMGDVLKGIDNVLYFQDDILIFGDTVQTHNVTLSNVLQRLFEAGLTLRKDK